MITCSRKKDRLPSRLRGAKKTTLERNTSGRTEDEKNTDPKDPPKPIKNTSRGDRHSYCKYHKQHGHNTEECRDLLDFVEKGLKNGKFREYTSRYKNRDDERKVKQRPNIPEPKTDRRRDEPRERGTHHKIAMISGGIPEEGNPPSKKAAKRSRHSCLAVQVMPRPLAGKPPPAIVFSSEEIKQTTNSMN
ncbi:hypothetical protein PIB30_057958 [Stylosanthes scabra]|uniref:Reverse transcriptase domain-containing protein n=1 Tax=Stylosanthes scabra TaxID=79078 RepID=A0ABU6ZIH5_9FABA|nr:hypothetical protein [Stylosanthes scabra]